MVLGVPPDSGDSGGVTAVRNGLRSLYAGPERHKEEQVAEQEQGERISNEAQLRKQVEALTARNAELEAVVKDVGVLNRARAFFKESGAADPDWAAEFVIPHVRDVEIDKLAEVLSSDRFQPLLGQVSGGGGTPATGTPAAEPEVPVEQPRGFGGGPQPAGGQAPSADRKIDPRSPEFKSASRSQKEQWDTQGLVDWHPLAQGIQP